MWKEFYKKEEKGKKLSIQYVSEESRFGVEILLVRYGGEITKSQVGFFDASVPPKEFVRRGKKITKMYLSEYHRLKEFNTQEEAIEYAKVLMNDDPKRLEEEIALYFIRGTYSDSFEYEFKARHTEP